MARFNEIDIKPVPATEISTSAVASEAPSLLPPGKKWSLVWHDEFNGTEIDKTKWMCRESFWGADFPAFAHDYEGVEMTGNGTVRLHLLRKGDDFCSPQGLPHWVCPDLVRAQSCHTAPDPQS